LNREEKIKYWAIEKICKGYFTKIKDDTPPFKHDLEYLALQSGLYHLLSEKQIAFLEKVNNHRQRCKTLFCENN
jgi:hypothetical protein